LNTAKRKYHKLKLLVLFLFLFIISFWVYVVIVNRNTKDMTGRQQVLKAIYPLFTGYKKLFGKSDKILSNKNNTPPVRSFYDLSVELNDGTILRFDSLKGKKVLLVNTASDCGYTAQYNDLEELYEKYKNQIVVIGFPANDFKQQEKGTDEEIAEFCRKNFGVTFPLAKKGTVIKKSDQEIVFQWLTDKNQNGWNDKQPSWNFSKFLINEQGILINYFDPAVSPLSDAVVGAISNKQ
jgi:glutathione peroxidase